VIEVRSSSFRRLRGLTAVAVIADEAAFYFDSSGANSDLEILNSVRPTLATTGGPLIVISSPYARRGEVYETYARHYRPNGDPKVLVVQGESRKFNSSLSQSVIDRALERDVASASAEYLAQFRTDIENFISLEAVQACVVKGCAERQPQRFLRYVAHTDPSGGSSDSWALAIAHKEGNTVLVDCIRETKPPFSPEAVVSRVRGANAPIQNFACYWRPLRGRVSARAFPKRGNFLRMRDAECVRNVH
jgi:hypothetical protein